MNLKLKSLYTNIVNTDLTNHFSFYYSFDTMKKSKWTNFFYNLSSFLAGSLVSSIGLYFLTVQFRTPNNDPSMIEIILFFISLALTSVSVIMSLAFEEIKIRKKKNANLYQNTISTLLSTITDEYNLLIVGKYCEEVLNVSVKYKNFDYYHLNSHYFALVDMVQSNAEDSAIFKQFTLLTTSIQENINAIELAEEKQLASTHNPHPFAIKLKSFNPFVSSLDNTANEVEVELEIGYND